MMKKWLPILSINIFLTSCVVAPVKGTDQDQNAVKPYSVEVIKQQREAEYAQKLQALNQRDPVQDAQTTIASGKIIHLLAYQSGRGGKLKAPCLTDAQASHANCKFKLLDGMGDAIYGENHLKYRIAIRRYAQRYNQCIYPYCQ